MNAVIFLSGTTRGGTLEGLGRSLGNGFQRAGFNFVELSLLDEAAFHQASSVLESQQVALAFSFVSMGMNLATRQGDKVLNLWEQLRIPFLSLHGDSPAYFFDRHVVESASFVSLYGFPEHCALRRELPRINGALACLSPAVVDGVPLEAIDFKAKENGPLLFLKNGNDPVALKALWRSMLSPLLVQVLEALADALEADLDAATCDQIHRLVRGCLLEKGIDLDRFPSLFLLVVAQIDEYLRAVKGTLVVQSLLDLPIHVCGNNWHHIDFSGRRATYTDTCDYPASTGYIQSALGILDMSPNTCSVPHDRVLRAYGAHTLCLSNEQPFLASLPAGENASYSFHPDAIRNRVDHVLTHRRASIDLGVEHSAAFAHAHPLEAQVEQMLWYAEVVRVDRMMPRPPAMQPHCVWPSNQLRSL